MARKSKPIAEAIENAQVAEVVAATAESMATPPAVEPPHQERLAEPSRPENRWAKLHSRMSDKRMAGATDEKQGIRVDRELERLPGKPYPRVLISFPDDAKPCPEERQALRDNGFTFDDQSWSRRGSAANYELALRVANEVKKSRGEVDKSRGFYI